MDTDRQLRRRAEELRRQLELTLIETREAIRATRQITAECEKRRTDGFSACIADTARRIAASRRVLDRPIS